MNNIYNLANHENKHTDSNGNSFIKEVKDYIKSKNYVGNERIVSLDFDLDKLIHLLKKLVRKERFDWLILSPEETTSIESFLYYRQNQ